MNGDCSRFGRRCTSLVFALSAFATVSCGGSDGTTPPVNQQRPFSAIAINDTLNREIAATGQVDTLRFVATASMRIRIDLQVLVAGTGERTIQYALVDSVTGQQVLVRQGAQPPTAPLGPDIASPSTVWFAVPRTTTYLVLVSAYTPVSGAAYVGAYRLRLVGADLRPEAARDTLVVDDSVSEAIDRPGDVDDFFLKASGGAKDFVVSIRAETGNAADTLVVEMITDPPDLVPLRVVLSPGNAAYMIPSSLERLAGAVQAQRIRVRALRASTVGSYRLKFYKINRGPEHAPAVIVPGDTIVDAHDYARDFDEFTFAGDPTREYAIAFQATSGSLADTLLLASDQPDLRSIGNAASLTTTLSRRFSGATFRITVIAPNDEVKHGPYRFVVLPINTKPEGGSDTFAVGDTASDLLELPVDVDEFSVPVQAGQLLSLYAQALTADTSEQLYIEGRFSTSNTTPPFADLYLRANGGKPSLQATRSDRFAVQQNGTLRLRVSTLSQFAGRYRLALGRIDLSSDGVDPNVSLGVVKEGMLYPAGDRDDFTFQCAHGQEIGTYISVPPTAGESAVLRFFFSNNSTEFDAYAAEELLVAPPERGRITVQGSGTCRLQVEGFGQSTSRSAGEPVPYRFVVFPVNRAPEQVPATIRIGDVIENEPIEPAIDIDEFQLTATPGARFQACILVNPFGPVFGSELVSIYLPGLTNQSTSSGRDSTSPRCAGPFTVPTTGTTALRVEGYGVKQVPFRLEIRPSP